jgi:stage II sporulation protein P
MNEKYPGLTRPMKLSQYRYNQQATTGSLIVEVGCTGNTLQESLRGIEYFADCLGDVLLRYAE